MAKNRNIIIIEDNETFSLLVTHYLKNNLIASNIFVENSGKKAIRSIERLNPAVVVLDYYLEDDISAKDVMKVIKAMDQPPHVILLSSMTDEREKKEVMDMGISQFIQKSNESIYDLVKAIREYVPEMEPESNSKKGLSQMMWIGIAGVFILFVIVLVFFVIRMD
ncbi:MAG: response regulator [Flavobacteriales bacterium]